MAITTFAELKTAVQNWYKDTSTEFVARVPEFVSLAEDRIAQDLRIRAMETSSDITISSQTAALPTRFKSLRRLYLSVSSTDLRRLQYLPPADFWTRALAYETGAAPSAFTIEGENLVFGPTPTSSMTGKLLYWQRFAALSGDSDTNWILTNARGLLLYGSCLEAAIYLEDSEAGLRFGTLYEDIKKRVQLSDDRDRFPQGEIQSRTDVMIV